MKILMAGSEMAPLARTGGLGDVLEAFPADLQNRGHDVSVVLPFYRAIRENPALAVRSTGVEIKVQVGGKRVEAEILQCIAPNDVQVFLVRRDEYFDRSGLYGAEGRAYEDNAERFIFLKSRRRAGETHPARARHHPRARLAGGARAGVHPRPGTPVSHRAHDPQHRLPGKFLGS